MITTSNSTVWVIGGAGDDVPGSERASTVWQFDLTHLFVLTDESGTPLGDVWEGSVSGDEQVVSWTDLTGSLAFGTRPAIARSDRSSFNGRQRYNSICFVGSCFSFMWRLVAECDVGC
jgi:hypothetical protein